jgi:GNAT superfamily N-acetyltransferase
MSKKSKERETGIIEVNEENVSQTGFFCYMSKRKSEGYQRKLRWLRARFAEGMKIKMLELPERGFIEYTPGEYAWRAVEARGYMFIHCLWVVGKSRGKGYAKRLLQECLEDAERAGMHGVAVVTSEGNWLVSKRLLLKQGFQSVAQAPPSFELLVKPFRDGPSPSFTGNWDTKGHRYGQGITIIRSDQCPYIQDATRTILEAAEEIGIDTRVVELRDCQEVRNLAPSPYGVFNVIFNGDLLSYHHLSEKEVWKRLGTAHSAA